MLSNMRILKSQFLSGSQSLIFLHLGRISSDVSTAISFFFFFSSVRYSLRFCSWRNVVAIYSCTVVFSFRIKVNFTVSYTDFLANFLVFYVFGKNLGMQ